MTPLRTFLLLVTLAPALAQPPATVPDPEGQLDSQEVSTTRKTLFVPNPTPLAERLRLNRIALEVTIRRAIREALASKGESFTDPEVARAVELILEQRSGKKVASPRDIQAAHARLRQYGETTPNAQALKEEVTRLEGLATPEQLKAAATPIEDEMNDPARLKRIREIVDARRIIREHETGAKAASAAELEAAETTLRNYGGGNSSTFEGVKKEAARLERVAAEVARRRELREQPPTTSGAAGTSPTESSKQPQATRASASVPVIVNFQDADMATLASLCKRLYQAPTVTVADSVKARRVRLVFKVDSPDEARAQFQAELRRQGIAVTSAADGSITLKAAEPE